MVDKLSGTFVRESALTVSLAVTQNVLCVAGCLVKDHPYRASGMRREPLGTQQMSKKPVKVKVKVKYACVDGMHFFTAGDQLSAGLCAGSKALKVAYEEVAIQLKYLLAKNHGKPDQTFTPAVSFEEFSAWVQNASGNANPEIHPVPGAIVQWGKAKAA